MTNSVRVGVVGVGYLGKQHARIYARLPEAELVAVVDADETVAQAVAQACACRAYAQAEVLLDQVDAVSIVVPTSRHEDVAAPFLQRGIHILMEKPIAASYAQSLALVERAERAGIVFQVGHLERFNAGVRELSKRVDNPRFIEAHRMSPFLARATDVDVVTDLMIHDIDIVLSLVPSEVVQISAVGIPVLTRHTDIANARLEFANGTVANLTASRVSDKRFRRIRVFANHNYEALNVIDQQIETVKAKPSEDGGWPEIVKRQVQVEPCQPLDTELEAFIRSVRTGAPPLVDGRIALQALEVAMKIKEKIKD